MINIPNNDSNIIDKDKLIVELIKHISIQSNRIDISTNFEGPCAKSLGLYDLLDFICAEFNYPKNQIYIHTCNLIEAHAEYNIIITPQMGYLMQARDFLTKHGLVDKNFNNIKHFGNFIGHGNVHRLHLASYLHKKYKDKTLATYHCNVTDSYHRPFLSIEDMMFLGYNNEEVDSGLSLLRDSPIKIDSIDQYPILLPTTLNIFKVYSNFFVEIANVTYFTGNTFYIDEKLWRPLLSKTPFIVQGPQYFLENLRKLGFQTFSDFWDEGYQEDPASHQPREIIKVIDYISNFSNQQLLDMYNSMTPILEHNRQRAFEILESDFKI